MIAVIGAGAWGSALAHAFAAAGHEVALCPLRERTPTGGAEIGDILDNAKYCLEIGVDKKNATEKSATFGEKLTANTAASAADGTAAASASVDCAAAATPTLAADATDASSTAASAAAPAAAGKSIRYINIKEAKSASHLVFALSSAATAGYLAAHFARAAAAAPKVLIATKGLHHGTFMSELFAPYFEQIAILSGPSFAAEVVRDLPTAIVIASARQALAAEFAALFPAFIKPYTSTDVIGTQIAGAYKNIIAIASGICDALALGNNARAALLSRGLVEMARFGEHFGAQQATFLGLCGAGDLFLTASSTLSRNYRAGALLAAGKSPADIAAELGEVAEGIITAQQIAALAESACIHAPIAAQTAAIIAGKDIRTALNDLLKR